MAIEQIGNLVGVLCFVAGAFLQAVGQQMVVSQGLGRNDSMAVRQRKEVDMGMLRVPMVLGSEAQSPLVAVERMHYRLVVAHRGLRRPLVEAQSAEKSCEEVPEVGLLVEVEE